MALDDGHRGGGKSRFLGRVLAWLDFIRGTPLVILDPIGSVIDNVLDKIPGCRRRSRERLWPRIRIDLAGHHGSVVPLPVLLPLWQRITL